MALHRTQRLFVVLLTWSLLACLASAKLSEVTNLQHNYDELSSSEIRPAFIELPQPKNSQMDCTKCVYEDGEELKDIVEESFSNDDIQRWSENTDEKAENILNMLRDLETNKLPDEDEVEKNIGESQKLLHYYEKIKNRLKDVLERVSGVSFRLPSEHPIYVDASGKHWGDAEMKDDLDLLFRKFKQDALEDQVAYQRELERKDVMMESDLKKAKEAAAAAKAAKNGAAAGGAQQPGQQQQQQPAGSIVVDSSSNTVTPMFTSGMGSLMTLSSNNPTCCSCGCQCSSLCSCACSTSAAAEGRVVATADVVSSDTYITPSVGTIPASSSVVSGSSSNSAMVTPATPAVAVLPRNGRDGDCQPPMCVESPVAASDIIRQPSAPTVKPSKMKKKKSTKKSKKQKKSKKTSKPKKRTRTNGGKLL